MTKRQLRTLIEKQLARPLYQDATEEHAAVLEDAWREIMPRHRFLATSYRKVARGSRAAAVLRRMLDALGPEGPPTARAATGRERRRQLTEDRDIGGMMIAGMAEAVWTTAWNTWDEDETGRMPRVPPAALVFAGKIARAISRVNGGESLASIAHRAERANGGAEISYRQLGWNLAMQVGDFDYTWVASGNAHFPLLLPQAEWHAELVRTPGRRSTWRIDGSISELPRRW